MSTTPVCPKGGRHLTAMHAAACPACQEQAVVLLDSAEHEFANFHRLEPAPRCWKTSAMAERKHEH